MELLGVHYVRAVLNASTVQEQPVAEESYRYGTLSPTLEFSTAKGLIANRVHCPATLLNGERRHSSGGWDVARQYGAIERRFVPPPLPPATETHASTEVRHGVGT